MYESDGKTSCMLYVYDGEFMISGNSWIHCPTCKVFVPSAYDQPITRSMIRKVKRDNIQVLHY